MVHPMHLKNNGTVHEGILHVASKSVFPPPKQGPQIIRHEKKLNDKG